MTTETPDDITERLRMESRLSRNGGVLFLPVLLDKAADEIEALRAQVAQYKEDAERFCAIEHDFSVMSPNIDGNHYWIWRGRGYRGANLREAIDKARKS